MNGDNVTFEIYWFTFKNLLFYSVILIIISRARSKLIKKINLANIKGEYKMFYCKIACVFEGEARIF